MYVSSICLKTGVRKPDVAQALLVRTRRPQAALLLEMKQGTPVDTPQQQEEVLLRLWPLIDEVNRVFTDYARTTGELNLILSAAKRMARVARGTVQRSATVGLYEEELDLIFAKSTAAA